MKNATGKLKRVSENYFKEHNQNPKQPPALKKDDDDEKSKPGAGDS